MECNNLPRRVQAVALEYANDSFTEPHPLDRAVRVTRLVAQRTALRRTVNPWAWQNNSAISSKKGFDDSGQFGNNLATTLAMSPQRRYNAAV